jgi:hypothetical protein
MKYGIKENRPGGKEYAFFHMSSSLPAMSAVFLSKSTCLQVECRRIERCTNTQKHTKRTHRKRKEKKRSKREKSEASTKEHSATEREKAKHAKEKFSGRASLSR